MIDADIVNEFASAEMALAALHDLTREIGNDDLHRCTPCAEWDVEALAEHLINTISRLAVAAGIPTAAPNSGSIDQRIQQLTQPLVAKWRCRGLADHVLFAGWTLPAQLALGILPPELVVHGWDFAVAVHRRIPISVFTDHVSEPDAVVARLQRFDAVCVLRERAPLTREILKWLPRLKMIASTGPGNASIDRQASL